MSESQFEDIGKSFIRVSSVENQFHELKQEIKNLNQQINGLVQSKNEMVKELKSYFQQIQEKENRIHSMSNSIFNLSQKILKLDEQNERLKWEIELSQAKHQQILEEKIKDSNEQVTLSRQLDDIMAKYGQPIKSLEQKLAKEKQQVSILSKFLSQKDELIHYLQSQTQTLLKQIQLLNKENTSLKLQSHQKNNANNGPIDQPQVIQSTIQKLQNLFQQNKKEAQNKIKTNPLIETQELLERLKAYENEQRSLQEKVNSQRLQILEGQNKYQELQKLHNQFKQEQTIKYKGKVKSLSQLQKLYHQALDQQHKHEQKIQQHSKQWAQLVSDNCKYAKELIHREQKVTSLVGQRDIMIKKIIVMNQQITQLNQRLTKANKQLGDTRSLQNDFFILETVKKQLQNELSNLKQQIEVQRIANKAQFEQYKQYQANIESLNKNIKEVNQQNIHLISKQKYTLEDAKKITQASICNLFKSILQMKFQKHIETSSFVAQIIKAKKDWIKLFYKYELASGHHNNDSLIQNIKYVKK